MTDLMSKFQGTAAEFDAIVVAVRAFIDKFVQTYSEEIVVCKDEEEFLNLIAELGDELYKGSGILEVVDYEIFKFILNKALRPMLDKMLGIDWFVKFKSQAKALQEAVKPK